MWSVCRSSVVTLPSFLSSLNIITSSLPSKSSNLIRMASSSSSSHNITDNNNSDNASVSPSSAIDFLTLCHSLKTTKRAGWVKREVENPESISDHMYRMGLMALISSDIPGVNREKKDSPSKSETGKLADALAIAQHHDAVTGTERQHVADDYNLRLHLGYLEAEKLVSSSLSSMTTKHGETKTSFQQCPLLNISYCPPSETLLSNEKNLVVVVYNPLGWNREEVIRIPVTIDKVTVQDSSGREVESQLVPLTNASLSLRNDHVKAYLGKTLDAAIKYLLAFSVTVPPLGFSTYIVSGAQAGARSTMSSIFTMQENENSTVEIGQGNLKLLYSVDGRKLVQYANSRNSVNAAVEQSNSYYTGFSGTDGDTQDSSTVMRGPLFDEVHQQPTSWMHQELVVDFGLCSSLFSSNLSVLWSLWFRKTDSTK